MLAYTVLARKWRELQTMWDDPAEPTRNGYKNTRSVELYLAIDTSFNVIVVSPPQN